MWGLKNLRERAHEELQHGICPKYCSSCVSQSVFEYFQIELEGLGGRFNETNRGIENKSGCGVSLGRS